MASPKIQSGTASLGNTGAGTCTYGAAQTAGNLNAVAVLVFGYGGSSTGFVITDTALNTYALRAYVADASGGSGASIALFDCASIVSAGAGNTLTIAFPGVGTFGDAVFVEYPPVSGVRTSHPDSQFGGTAIVPRANLTGTSVGDFVFGACWDNNNTLSAARTIGANTANLAAAHPDGWMTEDGLSDGSSPCVVSFGSGATTDWFSAVAVAYISGGATQPSVAVTALAETLTGQSVKGAKTGKIATLAETFAGKTVLGKKAAIIAVRALSWLGQAVLGKKAGVVAVKALTFTGQAVLGRKAGVVGVHALSWLGQAVLGKKAGVVAAGAETWAGQTVTGTASGPGAQPSISVSVLALAWSGVAVLGRKASVVAVKALTFTGQAVLARKAGVVAPLSESLAGQAVLARKSALVSARALSWTGQTTRGARAGVVAPCAFVWTGQNVDGRIVIVRVNVQALTEVWSGQTVTWSAVPTALLLEENRIWRAPARIRMTGHGRVRITG